MKIKRSYYTELGLAKLKKRLEDLLTERPLISQQIGEARAKGDLSENAEYHAAKARQGIIEANIAKLKQLLTEAILVDPSNINTEQVSLFNKVTFRNQKNRKEMTYTLVTPEEASLEDAKISIASPIGQGLLGKKAGEETTIETPTGKIMLKIIKIA